MSAPGKDLPACRGKTNCPVVLPAATETSATGGKVLPLLILSIPSPFCPSPLHHTAAGGHGSVTSCSITVAGPVAEVATGRQLSFPAQPPEQVKADGKHAGRSHPSVLWCCDLSSWSRPGCKHEMWRSSGEPWSWTGASFPVPLS